MDSDEEADADEEEEEEDDEEAGKSWEELEEEALRCAGPLHCVWMHSAMWAQVRQSVESWAANPGRSWRRRPCGALVPYHCTCTHAAV